MSKTISLITNLPDIAHDIYDVIHMMLPEWSVRIDGSGFVRVVHSHTVDGAYWLERCEYLADDSAICDSAPFHFEWRVPIPVKLDETDEAFALLTKRLMKRAAKQCCYYLLKRITGRTPPWGALTGIRPTRLYAERLTAGDTHPERTLIRRYDMRQDKAAVLGEIARQQAPYLAPPESAVDIYVGVPYCVSRCTYCSFKTEVIPRDPRKSDAYISCLVSEIEQTRCMIDEAGLTVRAIYMGGGTPTSLSADQLDRVLSALDEAFICTSSLSQLEYTVEAGRPDTLDMPRLSVLRHHPVTRVSINPQTMNDATLQLIGRRHTPLETIEAFERARSLGFDNINMDVIAALPGESLADFHTTLSHIKMMNPESLTIHTLALKRSSKLYDDPSFIKPDANMVESMVKSGADAARDMEMYPYYLYRQKQIAGDQENVGYAKSGYACIYNIDMMEETVSILALGAGGISKRVRHDPVRGLIIERAANMMEASRYVERLPEMVNRKRALWGLAR